MHKHFATNMVSSWMKIPYFNSAIVQHGSKRFPAASAANKMSSMLTQKVNAKKAGSRCGAAFSVGYILPVFKICPTDVLVVVTGTNTPATWTAPFVTTFCSTVNVTSIQQPCSRFPIGSLVISFYAIDGKDNGAVPCTFSSKDTTKQSFLFAN